MTLRRCWARRRWPRRIDCEIVAQFGQPVFVLARNVQEHVKSCVESLTGLSVAQVNVNVSGIALPREGKK